MKLVVGRPPRPPTADMGMYSYGHTNIWAYDYMVI